LITEDDFQKLLHTAEKVEKVNINFEDEFDDLLESSSESIEFWNNDIDDKIWNNA
jgi:hypothetical protein